MYRIYITQQSTDDDGTIVGSSGPEYTAPVSTCRVNTYICAQACHNYSSALRTDMPRKSVDNHGHCRQKGHIKWSVQTFCLILHVYDK